MNKKIGLLGNNISYSISPVFHNYWLKLFNINCKYEILDIEENELTLNNLSFLIKEGYLGFNVTIPYKEIILNYINNITNIVKVVKASNNLYLENKVIYADNTDYFGFLGSLIFNKTNDLSLKHINNKNILNLFNNESALIIGAGGACKAVIYSLLRCNIECIYVINRNIKKAYLVKEIFNHNKIIVVENVTQVKNVSLVVNCTPKENISFLTYDFNKIVNKNCIFYDLNYKPLNTLFLNQARENGFKVINGLLMLVLQGSLSFKRWFNIFPSIDKKLLNMLEERL